MSREPEEAATPLHRTPPTKGNPCPRSLRPRLEGQWAPAPRAARPTVPADLQDYTARLVSTTASSPPSSPHNMLTATLLLGGCTGTNGETLNLEHSHMSVQLEVCGLVTQGEIILWQFGFGCVKTHLIASKPTFKGQHSPAIDGWSWKIYINITAKTETIPFIWGLQFPTLLSVKQTKTTQWKQHELLLPSRNLESKIPFLPQCKYYFGRRHKQTNNVSNDLALKCNFARIWSKYTFFF